MKSVWSDEYRASVARIRGPYLRVRRWTVFALAIITPLFLAVSVAGFAMRASYPAFAAFAFAAPVFLAANWVAAALFLRTLAARRDAALRDLDLEYRGGPITSDENERRPE